MNKYIEPEIKEINISCSVITTSPSPGGENTSDIEENMEDTL